MRRPDAKATAEPMRGRKPIRRRMAAMARKRAQHRHGRLRLHGPGPFQRLSHASNSSTSLPAGAEGRLRPRPRRRRRPSPTRGATKSIETDWRKLVERKDIDAIDICVPNDLHAEIAIAAAKAGKMVLCEKPLARTAKEGEPMVAAVEKAGVAEHSSGTTTAACRRSRFIKQIVDSGKLGKIFHYRAKFLQDWTISPDVPQGGAGTWRLDVEAAGSGVTGDLLAHCIDTAIWINGSITSLTAMTETFVKKRKHAAHRQGAGGRHRRCRGGALPLRERLARHLRIDPLRPRPQGALHPGDQRRARLARLGPARPEPAALVRPPRRRAAPRLDVDPRHRRRPPLPRQMVGAGPDIGYEHSFVHHVADFIEGLATRQAGRADFPRCAGDNEGLRRDHRVGKDGEMGGS